MKFNFNFIPLVALFLVCCMESATDSTAQDEANQNIGREQVATFINYGGEQYEIADLSKIVHQATGWLPQSKYDIITKENIIKILPQEKQFENCDMECALHVTHETKAHWVLMIDVVKFDGELRVGLSLHHGQSGKLRSSGRVKAKKLEELEGLLQSEVIELFVTIDPFLQERLSVKLDGVKGLAQERIKVWKGVIAERDRRKQKALLELAEIEARDTQQDHEREVRMERDWAKLSKIFSLKKMSDEDKLSWAEAFFEAYGAVSELNPHLSDVTLQSYARKLGERFVIMERESRAELQQRVFRVRKIALKRCELERGLEGVGDLIERERTCERERKQQALRGLIEREVRDAYQMRDQKMRRETAWSKLSELLSFEVISDKDKLSWVEAFLEEYGAVYELNPHLSDVTLQSYARKLGERFVTMKREGQAEAQRRSSRIRELTLKYCELETGVEGELCLMRRERELGIEFVMIPEGLFQMGSNEGDFNEKPIHSVRVPAFWMSKTEVTVGQYRKCVETGRCTPPNTSDWGSANWTLNPSSKEDHPINGVDWAQARTFAKWVGADIDLPTEAEWEYAARGGQRFTYAGSNDFDEVAWHALNTATGTQSVGTRKANGFGLYDMSGNVREWTLDNYEDSYSNAPRNGAQVRGGIPQCVTRCDVGVDDRVIRGGGWDDSANTLRITSRRYESPEHRDYHLGFRLRKMIH